MLLFWNEVLFHALLSLSDVMEPTKYYQKVHTLPKQNIYIFDPGLIMNVNVQRAVYYAPWPARSGDSSHSWWFIALCRPL